MSKRRLHYLISSALLVGSASACSETATEEQPSLSEGQAERMEEEPPYLNEGEAEGMDEPVPEPQPTVEESTTAREHPPVGNPAGPSKNEPTP